MFQNFKFFFAVVGLDPASPSSIHSPWPLNHWQLERRGRFSLYIIGCQSVSAVSQCCQSVVLTVIQCLFVSRRVSFGYRYKCRLKTTASLVVVVSMSLFRFGVGDDVGSAKRGRPRKSNVNPVSEIQESQQSLTSGLAGLQVEEEVIQPIRVVSPPVSGNFCRNFCSI